MFTKLAIKVASKEMFFLVEILIFLSAKPEVKLIATNVPMEKYL